MSHHDLIILGGGAAGLSAAAHTTGLSTLLIDRMGGGGELMNLGDLLDVDPPRTGPDLAAELLEQATEAGADLVIAEIAGLAHENGLWHVTTSEGTHTAPAVILATGLAPGTLGLTNEQDFEGMGLSHCAACDGPMYRDQSVAVAGASRWAVHEARELVAMGCRVTLITQGEPVPAVNGFTVLAGTVTALEGATGLDSLEVRPETGGTTITVNAQVVFVQTGRRPAADFAPDGLDRGPDGRVTIDDSCLTSLLGLFAAGDLRAGAARTLAEAMADGRRAAASACAFLNPLGKR